MKFFPKSPADWGKALFRFGFCCITIDVAAEFFLFFNYVDGLRRTVREWQSICQMIGLWVSGFLLLWSFPLLRTSTDHRSLHYALLGIPLGVLSLLWFYISGHPSPFVKS